MTELLPGNCHAEVWIRGAPRGQCSRVATRVLMPRRAGGCILVCAQHFKTAKRRGEWLFWPLAKRSTFTRPGAFAP